MAIAPAAGPMTRSGSLDSDGAAQSNDRHKAHDPQARAEKAIVNAQRGTGQWWRQLREPCSRSCPTTRSISMTSSNRRAGAVRADAEQGDRRRHSP